MKTPFNRLLAALIAWVVVALSASAQQVTLQAGLESLATTSTPGVLVAIDNQGALLRSTNNGVDFVEIRAADSPRALYALHAEGETVVAMGDAGNFVHSTNGGASFTDLADSIVESFGVGQINALSANGATWIAVGLRNSAGTILRSTDGGATWALAASVASGSSVLHGVVWSGSRWVGVGETALGDGIILTSADGNTWTVLTTADFPLYSVDSDGAGRVLIGGDNGTLLEATDGGATSESFVVVSDGEVSDALRKVVFLTGSNWVIGGDSAVRLSYNSGTTSVGVTAPPDPTANGAPVTALASTGTDADYFYSEPEETDPTPHGPVGLTISQAGGDLLLTLVGAEDGNSYQLESSTNLAVWDVVDGSTQAYAGGAAPSWTYPLPGPGGRIFYRALVVTP